jgi:phage shock protein C
MSPIPPMGPTAPPSAPSAPTSPGATHSTGRMDSLFDGLRRSPVTRSPQGKVGGVCAGVAERFAIAPGVVRLVAVIAAFTGVGVPLYLLAWLLLPHRSGRVHLERAIRSGGASLVLLVVTVLALMPDEFDDHFHGVAWVALVSVLVVLAARKLRARTRPASTPMDTLSR